MLHWFSFSFNCIAPILILVFMGYILRQKGVFIIAVLGIITLAGLDQPRQHVYPVYPDYYPAGHRLAVAGWSRIRFY